MKGREFLEYILGLSEKEFETLYEERLANLSPEAQIAARKDREMKEQTLDVMSKIAMAQDEETREHLFNMLEDLDAQPCPHDRHWSSSCAACDEINMKMFPEYYDEEGNCLV